MYRKRWGFFRVVLTTAVVSCGAHVWAAAAQAEFSADELARGQKLFVVHCARCHGMQGFGGTGPSLARSTLSNAADFESLLAILETGIPGTAMPSAWMLPKKDKRSVAAFVRSLGTTAESPLTGDPKRGSELVTRTACAQCHTIHGEGGVKGPDLTEVGKRRGAARLRRVLTEPGAEPIVTGEGYAEFLPVRITTTTGQSVEGLRVNEDGFTIQLRDLENRIHSFRKAEVTQITKGFGQSIMPSFASMFSAADLDDVVAYLSSLKGKK